MTKLKTPLDVYKLLPGTNCGRCGVATCMAFAASVIKEERRIGSCPVLDRTAAEALAGRIEKPVSIEIIQEQSLAELKSRIARTDLPSRAETTGARTEGGALIVRCLGKDFAIGADGSIKSQCHTHAWFSVPLLDYVLSCKGRECTGRWVPFRELDRGKTWNPLFVRRCEEPLKEIADTYGELFENLIGMFSGTSSHNRFSAPVSVVLYPFPRVPVLICYWKPEDDMESKLHVFFDAEAEENLSIASIFTLGTGLVRMLEKIMQTHAGGKV